MKKINQTGFHLIHILPLVAIIGIIAFTGAKVINKSHAAIAVPLTCSSTYFTTASNPRGIYSRTTLYNNSGTVYKVTWHNSYVLNGWRYNFGNHYDYVYARSSVTHTFFEHTFNAGQHPTFYTYMTTPGNVTCAGTRTFYF